MVKKILCIILIFSLIVVPTGCSGKEHTYIIPKDRCPWLFGVTPEEMEEGKDDSPWVGDNYVSISVDEEGNLVLVLNDKHIRHWKNYIEKDLEKMCEANKRIGEEYGFELNDEYNELTYMTGRSFYGGSMTKLIFLIPCCGVMQMLNGVSPDEWYVDIIMKDGETGTTIKTDRLPDNVSFELTVEDWEKALGTEE